MQINKNTNEIENTFLNHAIFRYMVAYQSEYRYIHKIAEI